MSLAKSVSLQAVVDAVTASDSGFIVRLLNCPNVRYSSSTVTAALIRAAEKGKMDVLRFMVSRGVDVSRALRNRFNEGQFEHAKVLMEDFRNIDKRSSNGTTPLFGALSLSLHRDEAAVNFLIRNDGLRNW